MDSVIFRPVNVTGKLIKRQLCPRIIDGVAPLNVLLAPSGYGKTALALDVYETWTESRIWVNAEHHEDFVSGARILLAYLARTVDGGFSFKADYDDVAKLAIQIGDRLHLILKPFLLVVDGLTPQHDGRIIELFYELSQYLPSQHKILINGLSGVARPSQRLLCQGN
ncbi:MAG: ATP-binding protein, partial [Reinekea forsetii]|nr:ATP-binding protein [Reinekea forsetii]